MAKEQMGSIRDRVVVCSSVDAFLGGGYVLIVIEVGLPSAENVMESAKGN